MFLNLLYHSILKEPGVESTITTKGCSGHCLSGESIANCPVGLVNMGRSMKKILKYPKLAQTGNMFVLKMTKLNC